VPNIAGYQTIYVSQRTDKTGKTKVPGVELSQDLANVQLIGAKFPSDIKNGYEASSLCRQARKIAKEPFHETLSQYQAAAFLQLHAGRPFP
jgi:hypothetical protein